MVATGVGIGAMASGAAPALEEWNLPSKGGNAGCAGAVVAVTFMVVPVLDGWMEFRP